MEIEYPVLYEQLPIDYKSKDNIKAILDRVNKYSYEFDLNPKWVLAVIKCESEFNQYALRFEPKFQWLHNVDIMQSRLKCTADTAKYMQMCSYGLMQIMGATYIDMLGNYQWPTNLFDIDENIYYGCCFFKKKYQTWGPDIAATYSAYNAGTARVQKVYKGKNIYVNEWAVNKFLKALGEIEYA